MLTMAFVRVDVSVTSAITAVARLTLALLNPPTARATTKRKKLSATTHNAYEAAMPTCKIQKCREWLK